MRRPFLLPMSLAVLGIGCSCQGRTQALRASAPLAAAPAQEEAAKSPDRSPRILESVPLPWGAHPGLCIAQVETPPPGHPEEDGGIQVRILIPGAPDACFTLPGGLVPLKDGFLDHGLTADNLIRSEYLYLSPGLRNPQGQPALLFAGWAYASDPGSFCILWPSEDGRPHVVLQADTFELAHIVDLDGDGRPELVGWTSDSEELGKGLETYDPSSVYRIKGDRAVYDLDLSKRYNLDHYVWLDAKGPRDAYLVVTNAPDGKYRLLPEQEARAAAALNERRTK